MPFKKLYFLKFTFLVIISYLVFCVAHSKVLTEEVNSPSQESRFIQGLVQGKIPQASARDDLYSPLFWSKSDFVGLKQSNPNRYDALINRFTINNDSDFPLCPNDCNSLYDAASMLSDALSEANFSEQAWYLSERNDDLRSLIVVTEPQLIDNNGFSIQEANLGIQFSPPDTPSIFSSEFLSWIFKGTPSGGRYRFFIFAFDEKQSQINPEISGTSNTGFPFRLETRNSQEMNELRAVIRNGNKVPDKNLDQIMFNHICNVFVYEYEVSPVSGKAILVERSSLPTKKHLDRSGILEALKLKSLD